MKNVFKSILEFLKKFIVMPIDCFLTGIADNFMFFLFVLSVISAFLGGIIVNDKSSISGVPTHKELKQIYQENNINLKEHNFNSKYSVQRYFIVISEKDNYQNDIKDITKYQNFFKNKGYIELPPVITYFDSNYNKYIVTEYRFIKGDQ